MHRFLPLFIVSIALILAPLRAAEPGAVPENKPAAPKDDPALPRVLLIGDSISIGYFPDVRDLLKGKANVHHNVNNGGPTSNGVKQIDAWLAEGKWDVIHFNFGLHDVKVTAGGKDKEKNTAYPGGHQVTPEDYEKNLREIVAKMQHTGAKLIWASTTPVPEGSDNPVRKTGDEVMYNEIAKKVMVENGIPIDDLYAAASPKMAEIQLKKNVHFNKEGYLLLAKQVVASIEPALKRE